MLAAPAIALVSGEIALPPGLTLDLKLLRKLGAPDYGVVLAVFFSCMHATCLIVAAALACIADRATRVGTTMERLARLQSAAHDLLALTSAWLIIGVMGASLFAQIVVASLPRNAAKAAQLAGEASTTLSAALYSTLIVASFGPVELLLRRVAIERAHGVDRSKLKEWLAQHGFVAGTPSVLVQAVAAASPMLASFAQILLQ